MYRNEIRVTSDERAAARDLDCDWADLPSPRRPPEGGGRVDSCRPPSLAPLPLAAGVSQRHAELSRLNHFELLGLPETADRVAIARAFQREAARFHPDRLQGCDERLRPLASAILRSIAEAFRVLDDDRARARYLRELERRRQAGALARGELGIDPDELLQAARICLRRGRAEDALTLMEQACGVAPQNLQCQALLAWLRVQRGDVRLGPEAQHIVEVLTRAVRQHPDDLEIRLQRARALQRLGREAEALRDFSFVASADPRNVEAARELRLHDIRSSQRPTPSGVFSKFFARAESRPAPALEGSGTTRR